MLASKTTGDGQGSRVEHPADTHLNTCAVLSQIGRHQGALEHAQSALILLQEELFGGGAAVGGVGAGDQPPRADRIAVLAIAYHNMGVEQEFLKKFEHSLQSYRKGVEVSVWYYRKKDKAASIRCKKRKLVGSSPPFARDAPIPTRSDGVTQKPAAPRHIRCIYFGSQQKCVRKRTILPTYPCLSPCFAYDDTKVAQKYLGGNHAVTVTLRNSTMAARRAISARDSKMREELTRRSNRRPRGGGGERAGRPREPKSNVGMGVLSHALSTARSAWPIRSFQPLAGRLAVSFALLPCLRSFRKEVHHDAVKFAPHFREHLGRERSNAPCSRPW